MVEHRWLFEFDVVGNEHAPVVVKSLCLDDAASLFYNLYPVAVVKRATRVEHVSAVRPDDKDGEG